VLVAPVVPFDLAERESVLLEAVEPPDAETSAVALIDAPEVPTVSGDDDSPVYSEPVLVAPVVPAPLVVRVPRRSAARRLLVVVAAAAALSAAAGSGVFVGLQLSGNRAAALTDAAATPPPPPRPPKAAATTAKTANPAVSTQARTTATAPEAGASGASSSRSLAWAPVASATGYTVEITRNGEAVYSATTSVPNVRVPGRWRRDGRSMTFSPGTYRWYVWPVFGSGAERHQGRKAIVASVLAIAP
jgi:hypothetical protein